MSVVETKSRNISVVILSQYFWPEENATSDLLSEMAFSLSKLGYQMKAVCGQPSYRPNAQKLDNSIVHSGVIVKRIWSFRFNKNKRLGRVINTLTFTMSSLIYLLFSKKPDLLMYVTNPPTLPWVARLLKTIRGIPYIQITHDVYPEIAVSLQSLRKNSIIEKTWRLFNRWAYRGAENIVVLGKDMASVIREEFQGDDNDKIHIIPNWADGDRIRPLQRNGHPLLVEWKLEDKFIAQYSGNIGQFHEVETILEAAERLGSNDDIQFLFIGDGINLHYIEENVAARNLTNVTFKPFQPRNNLPYSLTACDVAFVTLKEKATGLCVPSKLYGILAAGKPVIVVADENSEPAQVVSGFGCGEVVKPGDGRGMAELLVYLRSNPDTLRFLGHKARELYEMHYTPEVAVEAYDKLLMRTRS